MRRLLNPGLHGDSTNALTAYLVSFLAAAFGVVVRLSLDPLLADRFPYFVSFLVLLLVARYCGRGPAWLALAVGAIAITWFISAPRYTFSINNTEQRVGLALYLVLGGVAIYVIGGSTDPPTD
jgi:K+-sensing histidine kinase KdpD